MIFRPPSQSPLHKGLCTGTFFIRRRRNKGRIQLRFLRNTLSEHCLNNHVGQLTGLACILDSGSLIAFSKLSRLRLNGLSYRSVWFLSFQLNLTNKKKHCTSDKYNQIFFAMVHAGKDLIIRHLMRSAIKRTVTAGTFDVRVIVTAN